jgi:IclR family transcriptional regulator, KDG regulon repressor
MLTTGPYSGSPGNDDPVSRANMSKLTSLEKALRIIDAVAKAKSVGLRELAAEVNFPPSTVHRLLTILTASRYLIQDPESKRYRLSLKFLELGSAVREDLDVISAARPHMTSLMEATSETVNLALFDGSGIVYVDQVANSNSFLRMFTRVGTRASLYCTGIGKACLAGLPEEFVSSYWHSTEKRPYTDRTIRDEPSLRSELDIIRRQGYAVDNEEMEIGVRCVASAIRQHRSGIVAGVSISGPSSRLTLDRIPSMGESVRLTASLISADLGATDEGAR